MCSEFSSDVNVGGVDISHKEPRVCLVVALLVVKVDAMLKASTRQDQARDRTHFPTLTKSFNLSICEVERFMVPCQEFCL